MKRFFFPCLAVLALAASPGFAASGELKTQAKQILETNQDAIVWLSIIVAQSIEIDGDAPPQMKLNGLGGGKDQKLEVSGAVVDPSGLIVTSLGSVGGGSLMDGQEVQTAAGTFKLKSRTDIKEVKVIMPDGTEIPADVVMKDADLDLVFFKVRSDSPEAKGITFKAIDLKNSASAGVLDDVVVIGRMDATMNRQPDAYTSEVLGVVKTPREFFSVQTLHAGSPIFSPDGKILGLSIIRKPSGSLNAMSAGQMSPAALPAKDILKIAEQAMTAKPITAGDPPAEKAEAK